MDDTSFHLSFVAKGDWSFHVLDFAHRKRLFEPFIIYGIIMNSVQATPRQKALLEWKQEIAKRIYDKRTEKQNPHQNYAVSLGLRFNPIRVGKTFDIENYLKPIYDGIAAGMFSDSDPSRLVYFNHADSSFKYLLIVRLMDANVGEEGFIVSIASDMQNTTMYTNI